MMTIHPYHVFTYVNYIVTIQNKC